MDNYEEHMALWRYLRWNAFKSVLICNGMVFVFYFSRFKTYRNSSLLVTNCLASVLGLCNAVVGCQPIFYSYLFNRSLLAPGVLDENYIQPLSNELARKRLPERNAVSEFLTASYINDVLDHKSSDD